jgi:hypothetical protein
LQAIKPEVIYFTDNGVGRGLMMIVDLDNASQAPHVTEPLRLQLLTRATGCCPRAELRRLVDEADDSSA